MIKIEYDSDFNLVCKNSIPLGFLGEYTEDMIETYCELDKFDLSRMSEEERKNELEKINLEYNKLLFNIEKNIHSIENQFIVEMFMHLTDCDFEFWSETETLEEVFINNDFMPITRDVESVYSRIKGDNYKKVCEEVLNKATDIIDGKQAFKKYLPMINVEKLLKTINPKFLIINQFGVEFEINSNVCKGELLEATVGEIYNNLNLEIIEW